VAPSIPFFVSAEVGAIDTLRWLGSLASVWHGTLVAVIWVKTVVDVTPEIVGAMKPWARANESAAAEPFRAVIA
jgi:hypothetical protein